MIKISPKTSLLPKRRIYSPVKLVSISILLDEIPEIIDFAETSKDKNVKNNKINNLNTI